MRIARIALLALLVMGCALILRPFIAAILFAAIVCITTWPLYAGLLVRARGRSWLAAMVMTLILALVLVVPMALLTASLADVTPAAIDAIRALLEKAQVAPPEWLKKIPLAGEQLDAYWHRLAESREELTALLRRLYDPAREFIVKAGAIFAEGVLQLVLTLFIAFFFYRDGPALAGRLRNLSQRLAGDLGEQMLLLSQGTINGVMIGIVGTAIAQAVVALIGFLLAGVPGALLLAALTFFLSMVPIGPPLVWGAAAFWLYNKGDVGWAIFMVLWGLLAISSVDNFVKPVLISRSASLPILLIALGVFGGVLAFGFVGIFVGPTLLALASVLLERWASKAPSAADQ